MDQRLGGCLFSIRTVFAFEYIRKFFKQVTYYHDGLLRGKRICVRVVTGSIPEELKVPTTPKLAPVRHHSARGIV